MNPTLWRVGAIALASAAALLPLSVSAQSSPLLAPADPSLSSGGLRYESPFAGFRGFDTRKTPWAQSNETAAAVGGHAGALGGGTPGAAHAGHGGHAGHAPEAPAPAAAPTAPVDKENPAGSAGHRHHHGGGT